MWIDLLEFAIWFAVAVISGTVVLRSLMEVQYTPPGHSERGFSYFTLILFGFTLGVSIVSAAGVLLRIGLS